MTRAAARHDTASDAELVGLLSSGDDLALGTLYDRHASLVFRLARTIVGSDADAEEVTADAFLQLWDRGEAFDPDRGSLRSWLATIARSRALDHVRSRDRRHAAHIRAAEAGDEGAAVNISAAESPDRRTIVGEIRDVLDRALDELSAEQRRAIELAYFAGLTQSEIAATLGEPLGTVKTRIRDGMNRLRTSFDSSSGASA